VNYNHEPDKTPKAMPPEPLDGPGRPVQELFSVPDDPGWNRPFQVRQERIAAPRGWCRLELASGSYPVLNYSAFSVAGFSDGSFRDQLPEQAGSLLLGPEKHADLALRLVRQERMGGGLLVLEAQQFLASLAGTVDALDLAIPRTSDSEIKSLADGVVLAVYGGLGGDLAVEAEPARVNLFCIIRK